MRTQLTGWGHSGRLPKAEFRTEVLFEDPELERAGREMNGR